MKQATIKLKQSMCKPNDRMKLNRPTFVTYENSKMKVRQEFESIMNSVGSLVRLRSPGIYCSYKDGLPAGWSCTTSPSWTRAGLKFTSGSPSWSCSGPNFDQVLLLDHVLDWSLDRVLYLDQVFDLCLHQVIHWSFTMHWSMHGDHVPSIAERSTTSCGAARGAPHKGRHHAREPLGVHDRRWSRARCTQARGREQ